MYSLKSSRGSSKSGLIKNVPFKNPALGFFSILSFFFNFLEIKNLNHSYATRFLYKNNKISLKLSFSVVHIPVISKILNPALKGNTQF